MALATDNEDMLKDPISKSSCDSLVTTATHRPVWSWNGQDGCHEGIQRSRYAYKELIYTITMVTGIQATDAQVIEVHDCFSTNELLTYEALVSGLCVWVNFQGRKFELFMLSELLD